MNHEVTATGKWHGTNIADILSVCSAPQSDLFRIRLHYQTKTNKN